MDEDPLRILFREKMSIIFSKGILLLAEHESLTL